MYARFKDLAQTDVIEKTIRAEMAQEMDSKVKAALAEALEYRQSFQDNWLSFGLLEQGENFFNDASLEETAHAMGKSLGAVKVLQHRALGALRRQMTPRGETR